MASRTNHFSLKIVVIIKLDNVSGSAEHRAWHIKGNNT